MTQVQRDVFLSYNSADRPHVEAMALALRQQGLEPWFDAWSLIPGDTWQPAIEAALDEVRACVICIGPKGFGAWQHEEMRVAIDRRVVDGNKFPVIPVLLPGTKRPSKGELPPFLVATTWVEFPHGIDEDKASMHRLLCAIRGIAPGDAHHTHRAESHICPYRGLESFQPEHAGLFFGREALVKRLLAKINPDSPQQGTRFLALIGSSGSGKSSLARAGIIANIQNNRLDNSATWPIVVCRPGHNPLENLAIAVAKHPDFKAQINLREFLTDLKSSDDALHLAGQFAQPDSNRHWHPLIFIDQFEELFTTCQDETQRQRFIDNLLYAASHADGRAIILVTLRADFYGRCASHPQLAQTLSNHQELIGPMNEQEIERVIEQPAYLHGLSFEPGLVDTLVKAVMGNPGALPLLQDTLASLWERRDGHQLTFKAYKILGELTGALKTRAEDLYQKLTEDQQYLCQIIFIRLTQLGEGSEDTKKQVPIVDLVPADIDAQAVRDMVTLLVNQRLLTSEQVMTESGPQAMVEIIHEALLTGWPRLSDWLAQNREALWVHQRLTTAMEEWRLMAEESSYLYTGARLIQAKEWAKIHQSFLNKDELAFLTASIQEHEKRLQAEQERQQRELRQAQETALRIGRRNKIITAVAVVALLLAVMAIWFFYDANEQSNIAQLQRDEAVKARGQAEDIMGFMLDDLQKDLDQLGRLDILQAAYNKALEYYDQVDDSQLGVDGYVKRIKTLSSIAVVQGELGQYQEALSTLQLAQAKAQQYLIELPDNVDLLKRLAFAYAQEGTLNLVQSKYNQALVAYKNQLEIGTELVQINAKDSESLQQLSNAYNNVGSILRRTGEINEAVGYFYQSIRLNRQVVELNPSLENLKNLALKYTTLSYGLSAQGQYDQAIEASNNAQTYLNQALAASPNNSLVLEELAGSFLSQGISEFYKENITAAKLSFNNALTISARLVSIDSNNVDWQVYDALYSGWLTQALILEKNWEDAGRTVANALSRLGGLLEQAPNTTTTYQTDVANYRLLKARILFGQGLTPEAQKLTEQALGFFQQTQPTSSYYQALGCAILFRIYQEQNLMDKANDYKAKSEQWLAQMLKNGTLNPRIKGIQTLLVGALTDDVAQSITSH